MIHAESKHKDTILVDLQVYFEANEGIF